METTITSTRSDHPYSAISEGKASIVTRIRLRLIRILVNAVERNIQLVRASERTEKGIFDHSAVLYPSCAIDNEAGERTRVRIGPRSHIRGRLVTFPHGGTICIGSDCYVGELTNIWSMASISIGDRVLIAHNVNIHDSIDHSLSAMERHSHFSAISTIGHPNELLNVPSTPIIIEDDAWIGFNATILKGVRVGRGAIVGACAVVTKDVEPYSIVVGNPARVVGKSNP